MNVLLPHILEEIRRKARLGIPLTHPSDEKQRIYNQYRKQTITKPVTEKRVVDEIKRKAENNIPLTHSTPEKEEIYNSYKITKTEKKKTLNKDTPEKEVKENKSTSSIDIEKYVGVVVGLMFLSTILSVFKR